MIGDLKHRVLDGTKWTVIAQVGQGLGQFLISIILARLLLPKSFGIVGMVTIFTSFAYWVINAMATVLVQHRSVNEQYIQSTFWLNVWAGGIFTIALFAASPLVAQFYNVPVLIPVTRILSLTFLVTAIGQVPSVLLQRRMDFRHLAYTSLISTVVSGIIGVVLAGAGAGVWSLVAQSFTSQLVTTFMNFHWSRWHMRLEFSWQAFRDTLPFTSNLLGFNVLNFGARNVDSVLVGRFFGTSALGSYNRTYALMLLPIYRVTSVVGKVMFPALSLIKDDPLRSRQIYLRAISVIALFICPFMVGLAVTAEPFVQVTFGENWTSMIPLLQILALVGLLQGLTNPGEWLYLSQGRTDLMFRWEIVNSIVLVFSIFVGVALGSLQSLAWSYAFTNVILFFPLTIIPGRLVHLRFVDILKPIIGPFIGACIMATVVLLVKGFIPGTWTNVERLLVLVCTGVVCYCVFILATRPRGWQEVTVLARDRLRMRSIPTL